MAKSVKEMTFDEFIDWAAGHILTELIKGQFRSAVTLVIQQAIQWQAPKLRGGHHGGR